MHRKNVPFEFRRLACEAFEVQPELFGALSPALPAIVGNERSIDLHAHCEVPGDYSSGDAISVGTTGHGGQGDKHGATFSAAGACASREFALDPSGGELSFYRFSSAIPCK